MVAVGTNALRVFLPPRKRKHIFVVRAILAEYQTAQPALGRIATKEKIKCENMKSIIIYHHGN
jgi:hypothetical protein